jgi:hypothetical protein
MQENDPNSSSGPLKDRIFRKETLHEQAERSEHEQTAEDRGGLPQSGGGVMPAFRFTSQADMGQHWTGLLDATEKNPELQQLVEADSQLLKQFLVDVQSLKAQQADLGAQRQEVTQKLKTVLAQGNEVAMRIRAMARAKLGLRSERLVHFSVAPLRRRGARKPVVKPDGETPGVGPGVPPTRPVA